MEQAFDYDKFRGLLLSSRWQEAHSYYRLFEEERYEQFKNLFTNKKEATPFFEVLFSEALALYKNNPGVFPDNEPEILYRNIQSCFFTSINNRISDHFKKNQQTECLYLIKSIIGGYLKSLYLNRLPVINNILQNEKLYECICQEISGLISKHYNHYAESDDFDLALILEYYFIFVLLLKAQDFCSYYVFCNFLFKHFNLTETYIEQHINKQSIADNDESLIKIYKDNKGFVLKKILITFFSILKEYFVKEIPYYKRDFVESCFSIATNSVLDTIKDSISQFRHLSSEKFVYDEDHEIEFENIFGKLNSFYNDLTLNERIKILTLLLFPDSEKQLFLKYGYFKAADVKNILNRYSHSDNTPEKRVLSNMLKNLSSYSETSLSEAIHSLRKNIIIYQNALLYFIDNTKKDLLIEHFIENQTFFEKMCSLIGHPSVLEIENSGFYIWQLTAKNLILNHQNRASTTTGYYYLLYFMMIKKLNIESIKMILGMDDAAQNQLKQDWENLIKKELIKIELLKSRSLPKQIAIILNTERGLASEAISIYFETCRNENLSIADINEIIDLWNNNLSDKEIYDNYFKNPMP